MTPRRRLRRDGRVPELLRGHRRARRRGQLVHRGHQDAGGLRRWRRASSLSPSAMPRATWSRPRPTGPPATARPRSSRSRPSPSPPARSSRWWRRRRHQDGRRLLDHPLYRFRGHAPLPAGVTATASSFDITVKVTDSGKGGLDAAVVYPEGSDGTLSFVNGYRADAATVDLAGTKTLASARPDSASRRPTSRASTPPRSSRWTARPRRSTPPARR